MKLRCVECGDESVRGMGWRAYVADDPRDDDAAEIAIYCPRCSEREFGEAAGDPRGGLLDT